MTEKRYDFCILGDINLDCCVTESLDLAFTDLNMNGVVEWHNIEEKAGGTGLNFARFCVEEGLRPFVVGSIGDDLAGKYLREFFEARMISVYLKRSAKKSGRAIVVRDSQDVRLLIDNWPNANADLDVGDIEDISQIIKASRVLYVSGFVVRHHGSRRASAAVRAMELAKEAGNAVVLDVVPHQVHKAQTFLQYREYLQFADVFVAEASTMRRFLGIGDPREEIEEDSARETACLLQEEFERFVLRFGPSGCDFEVLVDRSKGKGAVVRATEHAQKHDKRGFGDKLIIESLRNYFQYI